MKSFKDYAKILLPGCVIGGMLCLFVGYFVIKVDTVNPMKNIMGGFLGCFVVSMLNSLVSLKQTAKTIDRKISVGKCLLTALPYALMAGIIGLVVVGPIMSGVLQINTCEISRSGHMLYNAGLQVILSTIVAYIAMRSYVSTVKYTKRNSNTKAK